MREKLIVTKNVTATVGEAHVELAAGQLVDDALATRLGPGKIQSMRQVGTIVPLSDADPTLVSVEDWRAKSLAELQLGDVADYLAERGFRTAGDVLRYGAEHGSLVGIGLDAGQEQRLHEALLDVARKYQPDTAAGPQQPPAPSGPLVPPTIQTATPAAPPPEVTSTPLDELQLGDVVSISLAERGFRTVGDVLRYGAEHGSLADIGLNAGQEQRLQEALLDVARKYEPDTAAGPLVPPTIQTATPAAPAPEVTSTPLDALHQPANVVRFLEDDGLTTVEAVAARRAADGSLALVRGIGEKTDKSIAARLEELGLLTPTVAPPSEPTAGASETSAPADVVSPPVGESKPPVIETPAAGAQPAPADPGTPPAAWRSTPVAGLRLDRSLVRFLAEAGLETAGQLADRRAEQGTLAEVRGVGVKNDALLAAKLAELQK